MNGAASAGMMTFCRTPGQFTPANPSAARPAPIRPPNRACDELDGMPKSQVSRFHRMPPMRPAKMIVSPIEASIPASRSPDLPSWIRSTDVVTVTATSTDRKAPTRLRTPASSTAVLGFSAPVAIDVAIALPVSWKPLVKSNASAVAISSTRMISSPLIALILLVPDAFDQSTWARFRRAKWHFSRSRRGVHRLFTLPSGSVGAGPVWGRAAEDAGLLSSCLRRRHGELRR